MTKEELAKLVHVQEEPDGPVTAARIDQWMSYYDLNNDGVVDPQEWAYRVREDRLQQLVANHAADADGQMTEAELLAAGHEAGAVKKFFEQHDINGDGTLGTRLGRREQWRKAHALTPRLLPAPQASCPRRRSSRCTRTRRPRTRSASTTPTRTA